MKKMLMVAALAVMTVALGPSDGAAICLICDWPDCPPVIGPGALDCEFDTCLPSCRICEPAGECDFEEEDFAALGVDVTPAGTFQTTTEGRAGVSTCNGFVLSADAAAITVEPAEFITI